MRVRIVLVLVLATAATACVFRSVQTRPVESTDPRTVVTAPAKAHLLDGTIVTFPTGFRLVRDTVFGAGTQYGLNLEPLRRVSFIPLDSVAGMESYHDKVNVPATVLGSLLATAGATMGTAALAVAIFGSCPTIYIDSAGTSVLQAEAFSHSIVPLFEARDVDRLSITNDLKPMLRLEVKNEAAETHYINHLELLAVDHPPGEWIAPDVGGMPIAAPALSPASHAVDRAGRDVLNVLTHLDGEAFATDSSTLANANADDPRDYIDLVFPVPAAADSVALVLTLRNSLLTTVLLYDVMLSGQGARALDWIGRDLEEIGPALELGRWFVEEMGLRVRVADASGAWREVGWIRDAGPIAWSHRAVMLPVTRPDTLQVRLVFVADAWRIDRAVFAAEPWRPGIESIPPARIVAPDREPIPEALTAVRTADDRYLQTGPGDSFFVEFDAGRAQDDRTYLLATQGYYVEWMRPDWLRRPPGTFTPSNEALFAAMRRWQVVQREYEQRFFATRFGAR